MIPIDASLVEFNQISGALCLCLKLVRQMFEACCILDVVGMLYTGRQPCNMCSETFFVLCAVLSLLLQLFGGLQPPAKQKC